MQPFWHSIHHSKKPNAIASIMESFKIDDRTSRSFAIVFFGLMLVASLFAGFYLLENKPAEEHPTHQSMETAPSRFHSNY